ncbi:MAG: acyltransferase family protein [Acidimicrobiales bacterium]
MTTSIATRPSTVTAAATAATPANRERYVDFLRVLSLAVVVLGHWLMAAVEWRDGRLVANNVLDVTPAAQWLTWLFQIMPVFFVVGGFSNTASWAAATRDGRGYGDWLAGRLHRLVRPVLVFAGVWTALVVGLWAAGVAPAAVRAGSIAQPLWFLAVYVVVVAVAPMAVSAQRRLGWGVAVALAGGVATVDLLRWPLGVPAVGWLNLALVWLLAHQLGVAWRAGGVAAWSRRRLWLVAGVGLGGLVVLTGIGGYGRSMVGVGGERSNTFPPSLALVALGAWQFGLALLVRPAVDRWLDRPRAWAAVVAANGVAMTVFLWHLSALAVVAAVTLPTGLLSPPAAGTAEWWVWRPVWLGALAVTMVPLVWAFARVELHLRPAPGAPGCARAAVAAVLVAAGLAVLARKGFAGPAMVAGGGLVAGGWALLRRRVWIRA